LIKSGAKLVQQWQDVVTDLPTEISGEILPPKMEQKTFAKAQPQLMPADLTDEERKIWSLLSTDEPVHLDVLVEMTNFSVGDLLTALLGLEMRDLIREVTAKRYAKRV
jgi:predicted Rossmann fold nucleotide-binding protein DprA/Smf involved in DNA uptake